MTDDLRQRLERLADRAGDGPGGFEGLRAARARKVRRQRLGAGLLAVAVAVAGTVTAMTAFRDRVDDPTVPVEQVWTPPEVLTVWPENPVRGESSEDVQAAVDAGDESLAWRLDPERVAEHFARTFMAWDDPLVVKQGIGETTPIYTVNPCGPTVDCSYPAAEWLAVVITLVQPAGTGAGGIWGVARVESAPLGIEVGGADPALAFGSSVDLTADIADDTSAHAGIVVANGCEEVFELEKSIPSSTSLTVPAAENLDPSCGRIGAGYVFVYAMDDTTEPTGDPLLEAAAIEYPWLTIVPVYAEMQPGDATEPTAEPTPDTVVPDTLGISCRSDGTTELTSHVVAAGPAGVVLPAGGDFPFDVRVDGADRFKTGDYTALTLALAPGSHEIRCVRSDERVVWEPVQIEVVDPAGYWVDPELDCEPYGSTDFDAGPIVIGGDPSDELLASGESLMRGIAKVDASGSFVFGGYPESRGSRWVVLISPDGYVVARTEFTQSGQDWFPDHMDTCDGSIIF